MKPGRVRKWVVGLWVAGMLILLLGHVHMIFLPIGVFTAASSLLLRILFYKCPYCGRQLGRNAGCCRHCGRQIED